MSHEGTRGPTLKVVIADDHPLMLSGLSDLLRLSKLEVVRQCADGEAALEAVLQERPDILLLDLEMPRLNGLAVLRALKDSGLRVRIIVLTAAIRDADVVEAIRLGADAIVLKEMAPRRVLECINTIGGGGPSGDESRSPPPTLPHEKDARYLCALLTAREQEIVEVMAHGLRNKEIARKLAISEGTVKMHLHNIFEKSGIENRTLLLIRARDEFAK